VQVKVNDESREVAEGTTLQSLVELLGLAPERLAVELNYNVIRRGEWPRVELSEGDRIEIVHFVGGGSGRLEGRAGNSSKTVPGISLCAFQPS
jgi:thiamine biosynthesis protein ThiS